jgi:hypothetical protein
LCICCEPEGGPGYPLHPIELRSFCFFPVHLFKLCKSPQRIYLWSLQILYAASIN